MPSTTRWGLPYPAETDNADVPRDIQALANALDGVAMDDQGILSARPTSTVGTPGKKGRYYLVKGDPDPTQNGILWRDNGTGWDAINAAAVKTTRQVHTVALADIDTVTDPSGVAYKIGRFRVPPLLTGETLKLIGADHSIDTGTSVSWKLQRSVGLAGSLADLTGWGTTASPLSSTTTAVFTDPADITLGDHDQLALWVQAISGAPKGWAFNIFLERTA